MLYATVNLEKYIDMYIYCKCTHVIINHLIYCLAICTEILLMPFLQSSIISFFSAFNEKVRIFTWSHSLLLYSGTITSNFISYQAISLTYHTLATFKSCKLLFVTYKGTFMIMRRVFDVKCDISKFKVEAVWGTAES